jgi:hypothetical protein
MQTDCLPSSKPKRRRRLTTVATITQRHIVDEIIEANGEYGSDEEGWDIPVIKIVEYNNQFNGGIAWGLIYEGEDPMRYERGGAILNPRVIFERKVGNAS